MTHPSEISAPLQFAVLGEDPQLLSLARAAVRLGHQLIWYGETGRFEPEFRSLAGKAPSHDNWERFLDGNLIDLLLVGPGVGTGNNEIRRADQLRAMVQAELPVLAVHPVHSSMLFYFELEMIREETGSLLRHDQSSLYHPAIKTLSQTISQPPELIGPIEQITFERTQDDRSKPAVLAQLARDAELIAHLIGEAEQVTALAASEEDEAFSGLSVQLKSTNFPPVRWSVGPIDQTSGARITLLGKHGRHVLDMPNYAEENPGDSNQQQDRGPQPLGWKLRITTTNAPPEETEFEPWDAAADTIERTVQAVRSQSSDDRAASENGSNWNAAGRSVEIADATQRSLTKNRTINLYAEEFSEGATFKGIMASLGCGLLLFTMGLPVFIGLLAQFGLHVPAFWYFSLLAVLVVFLLIQLLPRFVLPKKKDQL